MEEEKAVEARNEISIGSIILCSNEQTMEQLIGHALGILRDPEVQKYLETIKQKKAASSYTG